MRWMEIGAGLTTVAAPITAASGHAKASVEALEAMGTVLRPAEISAMERAMTVATASAHGKEYVSLKCICLLYMNTAVASEETITLWEASVAAMAGEEGVFDIRQCKQYTDMLKKSTINCLERALKSSSAWVEFQDAAPERFGVNALSSCTTRFAKIVGQARKQSWGQEALERLYLQYYFFGEFLGRGMPKVIALGAALVVLGNPQKAAAAMTATPTVITDYDSAIAARAGGDLGHELLAQRAAASAVGMERAASLISSSSGSSGYTGLSGISAADTNRAADIAELRAALEEQKKEVASLRAAKAATPEGGKGFECWYCYQPSCKGRCQKARAAFALHKAKVEGGDK